MKPDLARVEKLERPYFNALLACVQQLQAEPHLVLGLELESFERFQCTQCGDCCRLPWGIHVSRQYYEQWYPVFDQHPSGRFRRPFEQHEAPQDQSFASIRRQPGTATCIFLEPDNSCFVHTHYGEAALSQPCVKYPRMERDFGARYASRSLLHSCTAVPELLEAWPDLMARFTDSRDSDYQPRTFGSEHPDRFATYLWLGLALDLLESPQPETQIARWRMILPVLEWMDGIGFDQITVAQMEHIYADLKSRVMFSDFAPAPEATQRQALDWSLSFLTAHPGVHAWLTEIQTGAQPWPELEPFERELLDRQLGTYLRSRLLTLPYTDLFLGPLTLWQQVMVLGIQMLVMQWLALYYRRQSGASLTTDHLSRAVNALAYRFEQRSKLITDFRLNSLSPQQAYQALEVMQSLDFATPQPWSFMNLSR